MILDVVKVNGIIVVFITAVALGCYIIRTLCFFPPCAMFISNVCILNTDCCNNFVLILNFVYALKYDDLTLKS